MTLSAAPAVGRVVVLGGGIAGVACVSALRAGGYGGEVVLLERSAFPYDRPPLSKAYLAGDKDLADIALQQPEWYSEHHIALIGHAEASALRPGEDRVEVELTDGRVFAADTVVLATGGRAARPPSPGADSPRIHVLRDAEDADALRVALVPGARLLVVGAGLIGAEAASTARKLGCEVVLVDPLDPPLAAAVGQTMAGWLHSQHASHGVTTVTTHVESFQDTRSGIAARLAGESDSREFDVVLMGVGMVPDTQLAQAAGLDVDRGILVDAAQRTSHPRVLAIGDSARLRDHARTEHWEAAQQDGQRAAATVVGAAPPATGARWWWSDRHDRHVEGVGESRAADDRHVVVSRGEPGDQPFAVFTLTTSTDPTTDAASHHVIGAVSVDDSSAVRAARRMIDRQVAVDPAELADPTTDLRKLLRG